METGKSKPLLLVIAGPTAVGKTAFAISLAGKLDTVILSADSRQFYKELNIGTAKPSRKELEEIPHYFIGHLSVHDYYNISRFEKEALSLLDTLFESHPVVILAGGSGLYIDALCRGVDEFPDPDPELRKYLKGVLADDGLEALQKLLEKLDPEYCKIVDLGNPNRILRALEVCMATGKTYSEQRMNRTRERAFSILKIGLDLPRQELFGRINARVETMMESGLEDEVRTLLPFRHLNALNTVGYKELFSYIDGKITLDQAVTDIKTNTRRYAKRQLTWFRKDPDYHWLSPGDLQGALDLINIGKRS